MRDWRSTPKMAIVAGVGAVLMLAYLILPGDGPRTVTAHFDRAIAVYPGTDLRVMGVRVGVVTAVVPDGNSVRVEMTYDREYTLPADAKAAVVTPTLVADRYVQVFPAYDGGKAMSDRGDIPLDRTQTPIELDRMYKALDDLAVTLGPKSGSTSGALNNLLSASAKALDGNGAVGSKAIRNMSAAAEVFASNRGPLFDNVRSLAEITDTLAKNDTIVQSFLKDLTGVSGQLAGERDELADVLKALAQVLGTVEGFVHDNRKTLSTDLELLTSLLDRVDNQKDALGLVVQKGALAMGNLALAFDPSTGTYGSRVQVAPGLQFRPDQFVCQTLTNDGVPEEVCDVLTNLLQPLLPNTSGMQAPSVPSDPGTSPDTSAPAVTPDSLLSGVTDGPPTLLSLLGGDLL
ncbi:mammalian cell entry protein [Aeromicrobium sp. A1-2]|uniref:MCE family protein n=1 Tax=Aeromicrobium sp. A1-2 TaxID=2107713 RepID=UPI000E4F5CD1|nr:MCE family protein [Aeromicrobium sp. A1-2]AXT84360.1 mammalian cell entry protein [Aeromicrobium sp. A1-2]